jgi:hypothetical protein
LGFRSTPPGVVDRRQASLHRQFISAFYGAAERRPRKERMRTRLIKLAAAFAVLAAIAVGASALAFAGSKANPPASPTQSQPETPDTTTETAGTPESGADAARQDTACKAAGIDPSAANLQYDDQTGACRLDTSSK